MKHRAASPSQLGRRAAVLAVSAATILIGGLLVPATSQAAGGLPSSLTLTASPSSTTSGHAVTLSATVKVLGLNGLGITPTGSVNFSVKNSTGVVVNLGSAPITTCLLTACTATLTSSTIPVGTVSATGSYPGDSLVGPSSGSTALTIAANPTPGSATAVTCYSGQPCDTGTLSSTDSTTNLDVHSNPSANTQTVTASLGSGTLHCVAGGKPDNDGDDDDGVFVGALATFSSTATDAGKTITYTGNGQTGVLMQHQYAEHTAYAGCYGSPKPFQGYTKGVYGPAPFNATDGLYVAMLANCANHSALPCMTNVDNAGDADSYVVKAPAGDPKVVG